MLIWKIMAHQKNTYKNLSHDDGVLVSEWVDNSVVCVGSTIHGTNPVTNVKRYSQKDKRHIMVTRPALLGEYNENIGGTGRMDQNINQYIIKVSNRKWYWALFSWFIDASINNAWFLCRKATNSSISQISSRRTVVQVYLKKYTTAPTGPSRTPSPASVSQKVADEVRYDGMSHLIEKIPQEKKRRCAGNSVVNNEQTEEDLDEDDLPLNTFLPSNKLKVTNELTEIKEMFVKIGKTVLDQGIQEWVKEENEEEHEDVGNQESDEEMPSVNLKLSKLIMSKRAKWTEDIMQIALEELHNGQPVLAVAKQYGIPRRTLRNHIRTGRIHRQLGRHSLLNVAQQNELCRRIFRLAEVGMPLTPKVLRRVFTFVEENGLKHPFSIQNRLAGRK
ncbi:transposase is4 [Holotrichia oblita]|uniref:Transposase is4 n=1 Tax=Holotrichia oblita TaxID=644536 RepID=A0ACB9SQ45_HOLOL|nr:transposase is4 [Holotrichia oblita]